MISPFDQIISSAGMSSTSTPNTCSFTACRNQTSSTSATPLPALKIRSTKSSPLYAFPSQCGNVSSAL
jgi:hypothetical protein